MTDILTKLNAGEIVIAGIASSPTKDSQGNVIPVSAFSSIQPFLFSKSYRNLMLEHSALQVGRIVDSFTARNGDVYRTGLQRGGLYIVAVLRRDAPYMPKIVYDIRTGTLNSFSIGATVIGQKICIHEVSICCKGANPDAKFRIVS